MSDKIFDLEQQIMTAWNVVDDIDLLYTHFGDDPLFSGMSGKAEDEMMNLLLGVKSMYALKFEKLWHTFEEICSEYHKRGKRIEELEEQVRILSNEREPFDEPLSPYTVAVDDVTAKDWEEMRKSYYKGTE